MTVANLRTYLHANKPPQIASAYALANQHRVNQKTARVVLTEAGYRFDDTVNAWVLQETQLDRIERSLNNLLDLFANSSPLPQNNSRGTDYVDLATCSFEDR